MRSRRQSTLEDPDADIRPPLDPACAQGVLRHRRTPRRSRVISLTQGTIRVDGRVEGYLHRVQYDDHRLGRRRRGGNIEAREVVIGGEVLGNLVVDGRVEVKESGTVRGDIRATAVMLEEGGTVHGHVLVHPIDADMPSIAGDRRPC